MQLPQPQREDETDPVLPLPKSSPYAK